MDDLTSEQMCEVLKPLLSQKIQITYYNIPPPRLNTVSPYPRYTSEQLNMRRKVEILKYSGSQQNTKTNNPSKKQQFSNLVRNAGTSRRMSQYQINQGTNRVCMSDKLKPTSTTASDVPGKPMILQYDPDVPLYNYGNNSRTYSISIVPLESVYNAYTQNNIFIITDNTYSLIADEVIPSDEADYAYSGTIGSFVIRGNPSENTHSFNISLPIAIWFNASIQSTPYATDGGKRRLPDTGDISLIIKIKSIQIYVYYNDSNIKQVKVNIDDTNSSLFANVVCDLRTTTSLFYAIKYVGMLEISNLILQTPPQTVYTFKYVVNYSYNSQTVNTYLDFIQTGVYDNLKSVFQPDYLYNCIVNTSRPTTPFKQSTFTQFNTQL